MKLSVCVPVYNVELHIERCARSLFEQTLKDDVEFIFVDDCSPDASIDVVKRVLSEYPDRCEQVRFLRHQVNRGRVAARRNALNNARGEFVAFCDADDGAELDFYEHMLNAAVQEKHDAVVSPVKMIWPNGHSQLLDTTYDSLDVFLNRSFASTHFTLLGNKIVRAEIYRATDTHDRDSLVYGEDLVQTTLALLGCKSIGFIHDTHYNYFRENDSGTIRGKDSLVHMRHLMRAEEIITRHTRCFPYEPLVYLRHMACMLAIRNCEVPEVEFRNMWPELRTWKALKEDNRLQFYKKVLLRLCTINYPLGIRLVKLLKKLENYFPRKAS